MGKKNDKKLTPDRGSKRGGKDLPVHRAIQIIAEVKRELLGEDEC